ncbi:hypothetical protein BHE74_00047191 [Ensete ventricosum]|nr:hypothetical protein GW17_00023595 [Ensete ventricosum]RWW46855.1 hypothetical protein BHE74_00047191 [Ensete ventricosum]RZS20584.1 hypothetical protein BHM03_00053111 [Ensete ventricosum]
MAYKYSKDRGQPTMARTSVGVASHGQAPYRGERPRLGHLQRGDRFGQPARGGQGCRQQGQRRWPQERLPVGKDSRRLRKGGGDGVEGARGVRIILL